MKTFGKIDFPALSDLLARLDRQSIPRWTGNMMDDPFDFAHYELGNVQYRLNRLDIDGARHCIARLRKHIEEIERDTFPHIEAIIAHRED